MKIIEELHVDSSFCKLPPRQKPNSLQSLHIASCKSLDEQKRLYTLNKPKHWSIIIWSTNHSPKYHNPLHFIKGDLYEKDTFHYCAFMHFS